MSILYIIILIFSCLPLVYSLEIERRKYGDRLTNGSICDEGTYVMKQNVAPIYCESRINEAGCDWEFDDANSHRIGFVPKEIFKSPSLKVKLLKMAYFPDGNCSNHSIGRIDVQNIVISGVSVWDSKIGENINTSLIYQFNYTSKFLKVTFNNHWDGMLIKLFINCLNETGENIRKHAETRCVMIKYEGNITYPIPLPTTPQPSTEVPTTTASSSSTTVTSNATTTKALPATTTTTTTKQTEASTTTTTKETEASTTIATTTTKETEASTTTPTKETEASTTTPTKETEASTTIATTTTTLSPITTTIPISTSTLTKTSLSPTTKANTTKSPTSTKNVVSSNAIRNDDEKDASLVIIIGTVGGVVLLILIIIVVLLIIRKRNRRRKYPRKEKNQNVGTENEDNNNISNPTYHADSDDYLSQTNKNQIDGEEETKVNEMPEYTVVNKTKRCSVEEVSINDCAEDKTKDPYNEGKLYSTPVDKKEAYFHNSEDLYDEAVCVSTPPKVVLDEYAVVNKHKKDTAENSYSFT
ncbi:uncharacterized protein LOC130625835 [Hydractinia symbiolongicarpus]|uniref:uncharacterized protein LOC130625835 n=1 Tax=Hydractinia symbiolongicarpus TaxID=13093 RepID=UPI00254D441A|nr:uncharacterized protein LOC130625835 [Hydractinia symbiolongicarpus]XP_057296932.1 uncharacterized protein LOC130625835 [Hydractinia symbiolongicarpus]